MKLEVDWKTERIIHCAMMDFDGLKRGDNYACYGTLYQAENRSFWDNLKEVIGITEGPWMIIGDLNEILSENEKFNDRDICRKKLFLRDFM